MKKAFYLALLATGLLTTLQPALAAKQYDTQEAASAEATDDGYILFVYAKGWDRFSEALCKKVIAAPEVQKAAGEAALILAPFYQYATNEERQAQRAVWGSLAEPGAASMETYPCLLMYDRDGYLYGRVQGPVLLRGTMEEIAAEVKTKMEAKHKQEEILKSAVRRAQLKVEEILREANDKAARVMERAEEQIALEKKRALNEVKNEVSEMAIGIAAAVIERDVSEEEHKDLIDSFIDGIGEGDD